MPATVTVAIVTARANKQTSFEKWHRVRDAFLSRGCQHKLLNGEFGALLAGALAQPAEHHVCYQLRALALGTRLPDKVLIVDRLASSPLHVSSLAAWGNYSPQHVQRFEELQWCPPMLSAKELELYPETALPNAKRPTGTSFGCSDKDTAIAMCDTDVLVMLDDCCLPGFGLVEAVRDYFGYPKRDVPQVMPLGHRKVYLEGFEWNMPASVAWKHWKLNNTDANCVALPGADPAAPMTLSVAAARQQRRVLGVWAMPMRIIRDQLNGYNTLLDGDRAALDEELMERCDRYLMASDGMYVFDSRARLYEIEHDMPWKDQPRADWKELCPKEGWRAPGASLKGMFESTRGAVP